VHHKHHAGIQPGRYRCLGESCPVAHHNVDQAVYKRRPVVGRVSHVRYLGLRAGRVFSVVREVDERLGPLASRAAALIELAAAKPAANQNTTR